MTQGIVGVVLITVVTGCGPDRGAAAPAAPEPAPAPPPAAPAALSVAADAAAPAEVVPLQLPAPELDPAPWLQEPMNQPDDPLAGAAVTSVGARAAIVTATAGAYRVDLDHGVSGPLPAEAAWLGLGRGDEVLMVDAGGRLLALEDGGGSAAELAHLPEATWWDFAGSRVIAGGPAGQVWYSSDGGRSFRRTVIAEGAPVLQVLVRPDGAAVARLLTDDDGPVFYTSRNGRRWRRSALQPAALQRTGAWIHDPQGSCGAVLARGSERWVVAHDEVSELYRGLHGWIQRLDHGEHPGGWGLAPGTTLATPPPRFARDRAVTGGGDDCPLLGGIGLAGGGGMGYGIGSGRGSNDDPFRLLVGTISPVAPPTAGALHVLHDGVCAPADAAPDDGACRAGAPWISPPHPLWVDRGAETATVLPAPPDCRLARTDNARGLGFLVCATASGTELRAFTGRDFATELAVERPETELRDLATADDGTIALHPRCSTRGCSVWIRSPQPAGAPEAWRQVSVPDAVGYRVVDGGAVVALEGEGQRMRFVHDAPGRPPELLTGWIPVPPGWLFLDFHADWRGLRLRVRDDRSRPFDVMVAAGDRLEVVE
jgi:hypothetical protein